MADKELTCRYCDRPIAVAMSTCPWPDCRETIMVICAACRAYTDNQGEFCEHCGEPLVAATFEEVELSVGTQALLVQLAHDQERARLVASGVLARYSERFFGDNAPEEGVLAVPLSAPLMSPNRATAILFAAVAYLVQAGYCQLEHDPADGSEYLWTEANDWDGQTDGLEARLATQAWQLAPFGEAVRHIIATETGMLLDEPRPDDSLASDEQDPPPDDTPSRVPKALNRLLERLPRRQDRQRGIPHRPAAPTVVELGWETVLPEHEEAAACEEIRRVLVDFEEADPQRAQYVLDQVREALDWFARVELDPQAKPLGRKAMLLDTVEDESTPGFDEGVVQVGGEDDLVTVEDEVANAVKDGTSAMEDSANIENDSVAAEDEGASPLLEPEEESPGEDSL